MTSHVSQVRALYRKILLLHRTLPLHLKALGDQYVKDEFRRHKNVGQSEAKLFMKEWELVASDTDHRCLTAEHEQLLQALFY